MRIVPLLSVLVACASEVDPARVDAVLALSPDADPGSGEAIFAAECERCHGADGLGVGAAPLPELVPATSDAALVEIVLSGPTIMPSFEDLEDGDLADLLAHLRARWPE